MITTPKKIFLDTDIGDDIDDALALFMLLNIKNADIVGISTVYANTNLRGRLAGKIVKLASRPDIPVYSGRRFSMTSVADVNGSFIQFEPDIMAGEYAPLNDSTIDEGEAAIDAIIAAAKKYKQDLTIVAIGPYTNIAAAVKKDKQVFENVRIVLMGGCFFEQFIEYNVQCDPLAAKILYESRLNIHCIGADVTWQVRLNDKDTCRILNTYGDDLSGYVANLVRQWKSRCWFNPVLHDPLAAYYAVDERICVMEELWVEVETADVLTKGFTLNMDNNYKYLEGKQNKPRILCAKEVDAGKSIDIFLQHTFNR